MAIELGDLPLFWSIPRLQNLSAVRSGRVYVADGSHYFSRPGPRIVDSLEMLAHTLHPEVYPLPDGLPHPVCVNGSGSGMINQASSELTWGHAAGRVAIHAVRAVLTCVDPEQLLKRFVGRSYAR